MRRAAVVLAALCAVAVAALAGVAALHKDALAFTLGVTSASPVAQLRAGDEACQTGIAVPPDGGFDRVRFSAGTFHRPGPPLDVKVVESGTRTAVARGRLAAGYSDVAQAGAHTVAVGDVAPGRRVDVCFANRGSRPVGLYGNAGAASRSTTASIEGKPADVDINLVFERPRRSWLSLVPAIANRAALFRAGWVDGWLYLLLSALVVIVVPALLIVAVVTSGRADS
jgi:hypothetical protein